YSEQMSRRLKGYAAAAAASITPGGAEGITSDDNALAKVFRARLNELQKESGVRRVALLRRDASLVTDTAGGKFGSRDYTQDLNELHACFKQGPVVTVEYTDKDGRVYRNAFAPVKNLETGEVSEFAVSVELEADYLQRLTEMRARSQAEREAQNKENVERLESLRWLLGLTVSSVFVVTLSAAFLIARYETRLLADLAKQRRLAELAQFSSGMAHQIKNPLAAMRGYAELIARQLEDPLQKKMSDKLIAEIAALDRVVRDFLAFSRGAHGSPEKVNLRTALSPIVEAARSRGAGTVNVNLDLPDAAANTELEIDATALRQALLNLGTNAAEALREIESENKKLDIRAHVAGKLVTVEFEDNGPGIAEEVRGKLFEPFVTGKADGTGLGLAISRRLLRDMGGDLLLVRTGPTGTMFRATFAKKG
ncbi:hypothetical protein ANRL2_01770, partial [Anaerolineae bacterium]